MFVQTRITRIPTLKIITRSHAEQHVSRDVISIRDVE